MPFIKVKKEGKEKPMLIPEKALPQFEKAGWKPMGEKKVNKPIKEEEAVENQNELLQEEEAAEDEWDDSEWEEESEQEENELEEKPLSEMNNKELREFAEMKGIDVSGLTSNKQLREAISKANR